MCDGTAMSCQLSSIFLIDKFYRRLSYTQLLLLCLFQGRTVYSHDPCLCMCVCMCVHCTACVYMYMYMAASCSHTENPGDIVFAKNSEHFLDFPTDTLQF